MGHRSWQSLPTRDRSLGHGWFSTTVNSVSEHIIPNRQGKWRYKCGKIASPKGRIRIESRTYHIRKSGIAAHSWENVVVVGSLVVLVSQLLITEEEACGAIAVKGMIVIVPVAARTCDRHGVAVGAVARIVSFFCNRSEALNRGRHVEVAMNERICFCVRGVCVGEWKLEVSKMLISR